MSAQKQCSSRQMTLRLGCIASGARSLRLGPGYKHANQLNDASGRLELKLRTVWLHVRQIGALAAGFRPSLDLSLADTGSHGTALGGYADRYATGLRPALYAGARLSSLTAHRAMGTGNSMLVRLRGSYDHVPTDGAAMLSTDWRLLFFIARRAKEH